MTAAELIQKLQQLDPSTEITMWVDGERYAIHADIDTDLEDEHQSADLNAIIA